MATTKTKKMMFGGLLLVSATVVLTWMHYGSRSPVQLSYEELRDNMRKSDAYELTEERKEEMRKQLELVKSLANEGKYRSVIIKPHKKTKT